MDDDMRKRIILSKIPLIESVDTKEFLKSLPILEKLKSLSFGLAKEENLLEKWIQLCRKFQGIEEIQTRKTVFHRQNLAKAFLRGENLLPVIEGQRTDVPEFLSLAKVLDIDVKLGSEMWSK